MQGLTREQRQFRGCGYESPVTGATPWQPPLSKLGYQHGRVTTCAGYTTRLPEVAEVARAHTHWSKGSLRDYCGGAQPTEVVLALVEVLDAEVSRTTTWALTDKKNGGGRE